MKKPSLRRVATPIAAAFALFAAADPGAAQSMEPAGVAVLNESNEEVRVFAFARSAEERVHLGWVGGDELEYFRVPPKARTDAGAYRIAVQQITPLPQIGVESDPYPLEVTNTILPGADETARVVLDGNFDLTYRIVP